ncbi:MAG: DUF2490 domain-containing protein [Bacteroidota bacterium]|nr:DUF2490 domain-containing protein [Bacteroidota bacterium]
MKSPEQARLFMAFAWIVIFFVIEDPVRSQTINDAGMWNTLTVEKDLSKKVNLYGETEFRLKENYSRPDLLYFEAGAKYKLCKGFRLGLSYRFTGKQNDEKYYWMGFRFGHRLMLDLHYHYLWRQFIFSWRGRFQGGMKYIYSSDKGQVPDWEFRDRIEIRYILNRIEPFFNTEINYQFTDPRAPEANFSFYKTRASIGACFRINKYNSIELAFLLQKTWNIDIPSNQYILNIHYTLSLPRKK